MSEATELRLSIDKLSRLMEKQVRQREQALRRWRDANPEMARRCQQGAIKFSGALNDLLGDLLSAVEDEDGLNCFMLGEFIDKFGPRLTHLNNLIQTLTQLGG